MNPPRVLLSAYQCAPGQGSVSQIGWEWYSRMARRARVTLVTHVRNRAAIEAAGAPLPGSEVIYIDTEWFAGPLYAAAKRLFPRSEHSVFLLSSLDYYVYDRQVLKQLAPRRADWDLVHVVTPVSPAAFTILTRLGLPVVRGPLNGGLRTPPNFGQFMRADSAWLYRLRGLASPFRRLAGAGVPDVTLTANAATQTALTEAERRKAIHMPEIAVEPSLFEATQWPEAPGPSRPLRVLFVGRLVPFKALPLLFEAARRAQCAGPMEITVVGDGPMKEEWQRSAASLCVSGRGVSVRFLGAQPAGVVSNEMSRCHVLCLPSIRESGGAVLLEAMSAARPVLAVSHGGPKELVNDNVGLLVPSDGPSAVIDGLATALQSILREPGEWRRRGENGRLHAIRHHAWNKRIEDGLRIYAALLNRDSLKAAA